MGPEKQVNEGNEAIEKKEERDLGSIPITSIMNKEPIVVREKEILRNVIKKIIEHKLTGFSVVNDADQLIGIVSEKDLLIGAASGSMDLPFQMKRFPEHLKHDANVKEAIVTMLKNNRKWLPVVDTKMFVKGTVSRRELLKVFLDQDQSTA